jgi:hypothetical protein
MVKVVDDLETKIHEHYPKVHQIFMEVEGLKGHEDQ